MSLDLTPAVFPTVRDTRSSTYERGYTEGHAAGYTAGLRRAECEAAAVRERLADESAQRLRELDSAVAHRLAALEAAAGALAARTAPVLAESEEILLASALHLAAAVLGVELHDGETSARAALRRVLGARREDEVVAPVIRMHPDDLAVLGPETLAATALDFVPDAALERGDAVARYPHGFLDARIGTALDRARIALLETGTDGLR